MGSDVYENKSSESISSAYDLSSVIRDSPCATLVNCGVCGTDDATDVASDCSRGTLCTILHMGWYRWCFFEIDLDF